MDLAWWIAVIGVPLVGAIFGVDLYIHKCAQTLNDQKDKEIQELHARIEAARGELYEYKINSAQQFATVSTMGELRREMVSALNRIEDKLDKIGERNDRRDNRN
jgi:hypothetical protein